MARSIDSDDYIDLSLMGGFDMGIDFDGFEENVKKIMEIPIKYLDSAHDKAVELIEDVHAMFWAPFPNDEAPNKLQAFEDPSSSNVITGLSPTSVETKLVEENAKVTTLASFVSVENGFIGDMDAHETESVLTKSQENTSSGGDHIQANDLCMLPKDTLTTTIYDSTTSEEIILWNPENSVKPPRPADSTTSEEIILWNPEKSVKPPQTAEHATISEDHYVAHALGMGKVTEQDGLYCSRHSETISHDMSTDVSGRAGDSPMSPDDMAKSVAMRLRNVHEGMENDKIEASYIYLRQKTSFKKMSMTNLSSKFRWSKKQTSVQHAVPVRSQDEEDLGYQLVSLSDDLDDDWEVL